MSEKLANATQILLFGRVVDDVRLGARGGAKASAAADGKSLSQKGVRHLLAEQVAAPDSCLARIYAFAFEGNYYDLVRPTLFLVHGGGRAVGESVELSGLAATARDFASDVRVWTYDKSDLSVRLDVDTGAFESILLEVELNTGGVQYSGQAARLNFSGQAARLRYAGQAARLRGSPGSTDD